MNACLVLGVEADGTTVTTIEGLGKDGLHPLQEAFIEHGGAQCGFCTPGMLMAAAALEAGASLDEQRRGLSGNLCRCTGYTGIYDALAVAGGRRRTRRKSR